MIMLIILCVVIALVIMTTVGVITYLTSRKAKNRLKPHHKHKNKSKHREKEQHQPKEATKLNHYQISRSNNY